MKSRRTLLLNLFLISFGFIVALGMAELLLRSFYPQPTGPIQFQFDQDLGAIPVAGQSGVRSHPGFYSFTYTNDSNSRRVVPGAESVAVDAPRILILGDSFAYGIGVDDNQTFAAQIQKLMPNFKVINAGNGGKGTDYALKVLLKHGPEIAPNLTLLAFFRNDFCDNKRQQYFSIAPDSQLVPRSLAQSLASQKSGLALLPGYSWLISWSHLANFIKLTAIKLLDQRLITADGSIPQRGCHDYVAENLTETYLVQILESIKKDGGHLVSVYIPDLDELKSEQRSPEETSYLRIMAKLAVNSISLKPAFRASGYSAEQLYLKEGHFSALGHRLAGDVIVPMLR